jgi:hypothetical protein
MDHKDKVQILFKEYDALRAQILARTSNSYQLWAIGAAIITWLLSRPVNSMFWILLTPFVVIFSLFSWTARRDINKAAERLRELEREINDLASADLLQWELRWGSAVTGYLGAARPLRTSRARGS